MDSDRERILVNIAAFLASELQHLQRLPEVQRYLANQHSLSRIRCEWDSLHRLNFAKGDLVSCFTSTGRQQNPFLVSFVEGPHGQGDRTGLCLRAIGTTATCDYGNESFIRISGIPAKFLWEGEQYELYQKITQALRKFDSYGHRYRGLEFPEPGVAHLYIGQVWGGLDKPTKPYIITVRFTKRTSVKNIMAQMTAQGFDKRDFEPDDGSYRGPYEGHTKITRDDLVGTLAAVAPSLYS